MRDSLLRETVGATQKVRIVPVSPYEECATFCYSVLGLFTAVARKIESIYMSLAHSL